MPPLLDASETSGAAVPPGQSLGTRQTCTAPPALPIVRCPPLPVLKVIAVTLSGTSSAVRMVLSNGCRVWLGASTPAIAEAVSPTIPPDTLQPPTPLVEPASVVTRWRSAPFPDPGSTRRT
jgi:hypothetical protein